MKSWKLLRGVALRVGRMVRQVTDIARPTAVKDAKPGSNNIFAVISSNSNTNVLQLGRLLNRERQNAADRSSSNTLSGVPAIVRRLAGTA